MRPLVARHPGFHRRREVRLREEEDMRAFRREQRRFESAMSAFTARPDPASQSLIEQLAAEGRMALPQLRLQ